MIKKQEDERESEEKEDVVKVELWNFLATLVALHFTPVSESVSQSVGIVSDKRSLELASLFSSEKQKFEILMMERNYFYTISEECDDDEYDDEEFDDFAGNGETPRRAEPAAETILLCEDGMILIFNRHHHHRMQTDTDSTVHMNHNYDPRYPTRRCTTQRL